MNINHGGIRELFKYLAERVTPFVILTYAIFSLTSTFLDNSSKDKYLSDLIFGHEGNSQIFAYGEGEKWDANAERVEDITQLAMFDNINKVLQRRDMFGYRPTIEHAEQGNQFDIDKIINDLDLTKEKRVSVIAQELGVNWKKEKGEYAKLAGIEGRYVGTLEQNQKIRSYLIRNAQEIYKDKHGWNEWDTLALVPQKIENVKMNSKPITGQATYNGVTLKVSAPAGSFPEGTVLKIKSLGDDENITTLDITLKEVQLLAQVDNVELDAPMASFDVSFYAADDIQFSTELQPAEGKSVSVIFDYADSDEFKDSGNDGFLAIYHMEEKNVTSIANLVGVKNVEYLANSSFDNTIITNPNTKSESDSIGIYANELSVYILTVVSELDEEVIQSNQTITFDAGDEGFIIDDENIVLSSTCATDDCIYTGKILSNNDAIALPNVQLSGYTFGGWYYDNKFLGNGGDVIELGFSDDSEGDLTLLACYTEPATGSTLSGDISNSMKDDIKKQCTSSDYAIQKYGQELFDAYNWAINNGITSIDNINNAKLNTEITREELAKMMVVFISEVLDKEPIVTGDVSYKDVKESDSLAHYIQLAYQYQIMGVNSDGTPIEFFEPKKHVSRGEFATVLSRVLFGDTYNQSGSNYYEKHIEALNTAGILSDTNHNLNEWRGWIITMLERADSFNTNNTIEYN